MFRFETPWALLCLFLPLLLLLWRRIKYSKKPAVGFSSLKKAQSSAKFSFKQHFVWLPSALRLSAWILLCFALARPQAGSEQIRDASEGIAIQMVIDRSSSMSEEMTFRNRRMNRLDAVKEVFSNFVFGDKESKLQGRANDLIGMITFARYPDTICPLTLGHEVLKPFLDSLQIVNIRSEDGTAIGDAVALAAARLENAEETLAKQSGKSTSSYRIKSKVIILLTDGENNCGKRTIADATELAEKWGIKVYTIAVTGGDGSGVIGSLLGRFRVPRNTVDFDTKPLQELADRTGGLFRLASDAETLLEIYKEIDNLEKSEVEAIRFVDYKELFLPLAGIALILLTLQTILNTTIFRKIP